MSGVRRLAGSLVLLMAACGLARAGEAAGAPADPARVLALAPQVQARGVAASLPPNLSKVLGLAAKAGPVAVRQAVMRRPGEVHVYNVIEGAVPHVVLFRVDEAQRRTEAYLVGAGGTVDRAVAYTGNGEAEELPAAEAAEGYAREAKLWLEFAGGRRPAGAGSP